MLPAHNSLQALNSDAQASSSYNPVSHIELGLSLSIWNLRVLRSNVVGMSKYSNEQIWGPRHLDLSRWSHEQLGTWAI